VTIVKHDILVSGPAFDYKLPHERVEVLSHVTVTSTDNDGFDSSQSSSALINFGHIYGLGGEGVYFTGSGRDTIENKLHGLIYGQTGILLDGGREKVDNYGKVVSTNSLLGEGVFFGVSTTQDLLNNYGKVSSANVGVLFDSNYAGGTVNNSGHITGSLYGIEVATQSNLTTTINNSAHGVIKGGTDGILANIGGFVLHNFGKIIGDVVAADSAGAPVKIFNPGKIIGSVDLGSGNALFDGKGGFLSGDFTARGGNDRIILGNGDVSVDLGTGNDTVTPGSGVDYLDFYGPTQSYAQSGQVERFTNFTHGLDYLGLPDTSFPGLGSTGHFTLDRGHFALNHPVGGNAQIVYVQSDGFIYYAPTGNGGSMLHFATIESHGPHFSLSAADFFYV
jgi:hypothetical protein